MKHFSIAQIRSFFFCILICIFASCKHINVFEKNIPFISNEWKSDVAATGTFTIEDTSALYNLHVVLRHTDAYAYNNIWLNIGLQSPGDSMYFQKLDLTLGNDASGWEGVGMSDIWEVRKLINGAPKRFKKIGVYYFSIKQIMRDEPLKQVMSVGLRVEKAQ